MGCWHLKSGDVRLTGILTSSEDSGNVAVDAVEAAIAVVFRIRESEVGAEALVSFGPVFQILTSGFFKRVTCNTSQSPDISIRRSFDRDIGPERTPSHLVRWGAAGRGIRVTCTWAQKGTKEVHTELLVLVQVTASASTRKRGTRPHVGRTVIRTLFYRNRRHRSSRDQEAAYYYRMI